MNYKDFVFISDSEFADQELSGGFQSSSGSFPESNASSTGISLTFLRTKKRFELALDVAQASFGIVLSGIRSYKFWFLIAGFSTVLFVLAMAESLVQISAIPYLKVEALAFLLVTFSNALLLLYCCSSYGSNFYGLAPNFPGQVKKLIVAFLLAVVTISFLVSTAIYLLMLLVMLSPIADSMLANSGLMPFVVLWFTLAVFALLGFLLGVRSKSGVPRSALTIALTGTVLGIGMLCMWFVAVVVSNSFFPVGSTSLGSFGWSVLISRFLMDTSVLGSVRVVLITCILLLCVSFAVKRVAEHFVRASILH